MDRVVPALVAGLAIVALVSMTSLVPVAGQSATVSEVAVEHDVYQQQDPTDFDFVEFRIVVHENGDARWTFQYSIVLEDEEAVEDFEGFAEEFRTESTQFYENFHHQAEGLAADGSEVTGREMAAIDFDRDAYLREELADRTRGFVEVSFTWTGFAAVEDDRVRVGDVFDGGLYLAENQRFVLVRGDGLQFEPESVNPDPDGISGETLATSESVSWVADTDDRLFIDGHPQATFVPDTEQPIDDDPSPDGDPDDETPDDTTDPDPDPDDDADEAGGLPWLYLIGGFVVLSLLVGASLYRKNAVSGPETSRTPSAHGPSIPDEELLSDEDRVISLLEERGGRMKQVEIVNETDWSKSKVSMLLSDMEEAGQVSKLRVGRENIVSLAGHEPGASRSESDGS